MKSLKLLVSDEFFDMLRKVEKGPSKGSCRSYDTIQITAIIGHISHENEYQGLVFADMLVNCGTFGPQDKDFRAKLEESDDRYKQYLKVSDSQE